MALKQVRAVLIDLSGTVCIDNIEICGSVQSFNRLRESQLKIKFVTNATKESKRLLLERLRNIGFRVNSNEIFTSLSAARRLIDVKRLSPLMMIDDRALEEFKGVSQDKFDSVLIGLAPDKFNYSDMNKAFRLVLDGAPLIAVHKARYFKTKERGLALGPGPFVTALEYSTGVKAEVVGKPESVFFLSAIEDLEVQPHQCVMIGDDARDDIVGAISAGMKGILVKTGKYQDGDERYLPENGITVQNFSEAVDLILNDQQEDKT